MRLARALALCTLGALPGCGARGSDHSSLTLKAGTPRIDIGNSTTVSIVAVDEAGAPGAGDVYLTAAAGPLAAGRHVALDARGEAHTAFSCGMDFVEMTCGGSACAVLHASSSEVGVLTFHLTDTHGRNVEGIDIVCRLSGSGPDVATVLTPHTQSDAAGLARCEVEAGTTTGSFAVTADTGFGAGDGPAIPVQ